MDNRSRVIKRRQITACGECCRRKQKCDRAKPCSNCVLRKVPDKCIYGKASDLSVVPLPQALENATPGQRDFPNDTSPSVVSPSPSPPTRSGNLRDQLGYSSSSNSNALPELLQNDNEAGAAAFSFTKSLSFPKRERLRDLISQLPQQSLTRELVDVFFSEVNCYFGILEKYYFEKLYNSWYTADDDMIRDGNFECLLPDLYHFPALLHQVLAVALQFLPPDMPTARISKVEDFRNNYRLSQKYSERGMEIMTLLGRHNPTIAAVEHDLMRSLWLKNCSRGKEAWHTLSSAIRIAQDLGLHRQFHVSQTTGSSVEETLSHLWYDEYRRKLWVKLFSWDSHMAWKLGQPRTINSSDCTIRTPLDCDIPVEPSSRVPAVLGEQEQPSSYTYHLFQYAISQKIHEAMTLGVDKRHTKNYKVATSIHDQVIALLEDLPPVVRLENPDTTWDSRCPIFPRQRQQIKTAAYSFLLALHRPHAGLHVASRQAAVEAALHILDAQEHLWELMKEHHLSSSAFASYTLDAGIFILITLAEYPLTDPDYLQRIRRAIREGIRRLGLSGEKNSFAKSGERLLVLCYQKMEGSTNPGENQEPRATHPHSIISLPCPEEVSIANEPQVIHEERYADLTTSNEMPVNSFHQLDNSTMFMNLTDPSYDMISWMQNTDQWGDPSLEFNTGHDPFWHASSN